MTTPTHWKLDVDKLQTVEDIRNIFRIFDLGFALNEETTDITRALVGRYFTPQEPK